MGIVSKVKVAKYLLEAYSTHYTGNSTSGNQRISILPVHIKLWKPIRIVIPMKAFISSVVTSVHARAFGMEERLACA